MIKLNGINFEFPTINKLPLFGLVAETDVKVTISGKEITRLLGQRVIASWSYVWLNDLQIEQLFSIIDLQKSQGSTTVELNLPTGTFIGEAYITIENSQTRFMQNELGEWVWSNYEISLRSVNYVS